MRDPNERLKDILDAVARIERYAARGREAFEREELIQVWIVHHLQLIGEAAGQLGRPFHEAHSGTQWPQIVAMRNILVHEYSGIDLDEVWKTVERDLPGFKRAVQALLEELEGEGDRDSLCRRLQLLRVLPRWCHRRRYEGVGVWRVSGLKRQLASRQRFSGASILPERTSAVDESQSFPQVVC